MNTIESQFHQFITEHIDYKYDIEDRIMGLAEEGFTEDDQEPMSSKSLHDVLEFLNSRPSLTLIPMGEILASWVMGDHKMIVRFLGDGKVTGVLMRKIDLHDT